MTNTAETRAEDRTFFDANIRTPEMEMAEIGAVVPSADELTIDQINPHNPYLFLEDRWQDHFARLRAEDPVHLNELETSGRYWSVTKYEDVRAVDGDWETYSSAAIKISNKPTSMKLVCNAFGSVSSKKVCSTPV